MRTSWLIAPLMGLAILGCDKSEFKGAEAEVKTTDIKLDMPSIPNFSMPAADGDTYSPKYLRLLGGKLLDTEVKLKGYVTWIYDCVAHVQQPGEKPKATKKRIKKDPSICQRPHITVGDTADTPPERSVWVVEVPRPLRKDEKKGLKKADLEKLPKVPKFKLGDQVVIKGKWALRSNKGFSNSDGLLVWPSERVEGTFENLTDPQEDKKK
jgi:hypothetical protein